MTPWQSRATKLTQRMADDMKLRNCAQATIDAYTYHVCRFAEFLGKCCKRSVAECRELSRLRHLLESVFRPTALG